jgi:hypothetical protein
VDATTKKRVSEIMDPEEFKRLLDQFGKEALAKAELKGRNAAVSDMLKILLKARIPGTTKEWLLDHCRGLARPPM